jgi:hypothetical protein
LRLLVLRFFLPCRTFRHYCVIPAPLTGSLSLPVAFGSAVHLHAAAGCSGLHAVWFATWTSGLALWDAVVFLGEEDVFRGCYRLPPAKHAVLSLLDTFMHSRDRFTVAFCASVFSGSGLFLFAIA